MATFSKRGEGWLAQVCFHYNRYSKTFPTKHEAQKWASIKEADLHRKYQASIPKQDYTLDSLIQRYTHEVHSIKPFGESKISALNMMSDHFKGVKLSVVTPERLFKYAKARSRGYKNLAPVGPHTLNMHLTYLGQVIDHARALWGADIAGNPAKDAKSVAAKIGLVGGSKRRERRVSEQELKALFAAADKHRGGWIKPIVQLAVHTGMRQGEICQLTWEDVDLAKQTIFIRDRKHPTKKVGNNQLIPISTGAVAVLRGQLLGVKKPVGRVFADVKLTKSISLRFTKTVRQAGIKDLHFHDLRHEAISRFFERGLQIQEVARISGHQDWKQLLRYTQLKAENLVAKLG